MCVGWDASVPHVTSVASYHYQYGILPCQVLLALTEQLVKGGNVITCTDWDSIDKTHVGIVNE